MIWQIVGVEGRGLPFRDGANPGSRHSHKEGFARCLPHKALFTSLVFSSPKDAGICGDLVFSHTLKSPQILFQKILYHDGEFLI
jgi:hypothetical protein